MANSTNSKSARKAAEAARSALIVELTTVLGRSDAYKLVMSGNQEKIDALLALKNVSLPPEPARQFAKDDLGTLNPDAPEAGQQYMEDGVLCTVLAYDADRDACYLSRVYNYYTKPNLRKAEFGVRNLFNFQSFASHLKKQAAYAAAGHQTIQPDWSAYNIEAGVTKASPISPDTSLMPLPTHDHTCEECGHEWNGTQTTCPSCGGASLF